jgi:ERCC4-related helicase
VHLLAAQLSDSHQHVSATAGRQFVAAQLSDSHQLVVMPTSVDKTEIAYKLYMDWAK